MGVVINHLITALTSPVVVSLVLVSVGLVLSIWRRFSSLIPHFLIAAGVLGLWFMSIPLTYNWLGMSLERDYPPVCVEELPKADAIAVLGGGVSGNTNTLFYTELYSAADRVAHAARLWKAGKAPLIIPSGQGELHASLPFLKELGIPESAILVENTAENTEQNARFVAAFVKEKHSTLPLQLSTPTNSTVNLDLQPRPKILLVTSAWHMRRALLLFNRYAPDVEVIPTACDYEATIGSDHPFELSMLVPNADSLIRNSYMLKEYIGYYGYKWFR